MSRADAEARSLVDEHGLTVPPVDPEKVAAAMGAVVVREPVDSGVSGMLLRREGQIVIGVNGAHDDRRQRFALAHAVAHLHLHPRRELILDTVDRHSLGSLSSLPTDREEAEANRFAGALLMPEQTVRRMAVDAQVKTARDLVRLLADRFEVPETVAGYRLISLGIIVDC